MFKRKKTLKDLTVSTEEHIAMLRDHNIRLIKENKSLKREIKISAANKKAEIKRIKKELIKVFGEKNN